VRCRKVKTNGLLYSRDLDAFMTFVASLFAELGAAFLPCIVRPAAFVGFQPARRDRRRLSSDGNCSKAARASAKFSEFASAARISANQSHEIFCAGATRSPSDPGGGLAHEGR
jgi:hypothetical protein